MPHTHLASQFSASPTLLMKMENGNLSFTIISCTSRQTINNKVPRNEEVYLSEWWTLIPGNIYNPNYICQSKINLDWGIVNLYCKSRWYLLYGLAKSADRQPGILMYPFFNAPDQKESINKVTGRWCFHVKYLEHHKSVTETYIPTPWTEWHMLMRTLPFTWWSVIITNETTSEPLQK